jgi:hypothetical protein
MVPAIEAFDPAKPSRPAHTLPYREMTFQNDGKTAAPLRLWTGDTLLDLEQRQVLKLTLKGDHLFIEAGGFSDKHPLGWKTQIVVMKRKPI